LPKRTIELGEGSVKGRGKDRERKKNESRRKVMFREINLENVG